MQRGQVRKRPKVHFIGFYLYECQSLHVRRLRERVITLQRLLESLSFSRSDGAWRARQNLAEMFSREEILRSAVFAAIGGIITLVVLKLLEKNEGTGERREIRGANN